MNLIAGATGHLGQAVVAQLLKAGAKGSFAILARNPEKAKAYAEQGIEVRIADYDQPESLATAFAGIDKLLFISTMSMARGPQQAGVITAAKAAGVRHVLYTGLAIRDIESSAVKDLMASHFETEARIQEAGLSYTFLRNTMYAEAILEIIGPKALQEGIFLPAGQGKVPYALRAELGESAANALLQEGHENKVYHLIGKSASSYADVAESLSRVLGNPLSYQDIPEEALREGLSAAGVPEFGRYLILGTLADIKAGQYALESRDLEDLLGREPASLDAMLETLLPKPKA